MYIYVGNNIIGSSTGSLLGRRPGVNTRLEERNPVGLELGGKYVASLGRYDGVRGRK